MDTVVWAALAVAGLLAGIGIGFWLGRLQRDEERVAELESELETYRAQVTAHFEQSATHFQAIGQQYRELYEHMAAGSEALCAPDASASMSFPAPRDVAVLAEPAEPVEPPMEAAAAATDVVDSEVVETTPFETDSFSASDEGVVETADDIPAEAVEPEARDDVAESTEVQADAETATDDESEVPAEAIADDEPEKRLYH